MLLQRLKHLLQSIAEGPRLFCVQQHTKVTTTYKSVLFVRCCYISALVLNCFRLTKSRAMYFRPETILASFLHVMVLLFKVLFNHLRYISYFQNPSLKTRFFFFFFKEVMTIHKNLTPKVLFTIMQ